MIIRVLMHICGFNLSFLYKIGNTSSYPTSSLLKSTSRESIGSDGEGNNGEPVADNLEGYGSDWSADNDSSTTSLIEVTGHLEIDRYKYLIPYKIYDKNYPEIY